MEYSIEHADKLLYNKDEASVNLAIRIVSAHNPALSEKMRENPRKAHGLLHGAHPELRPKPDWWVAGPSSGGREAAGKREIEWIRQNPLVVKTRTAFILGREVLWYSLQQARVPYTLHEHLLKLYPGCYTTLGHYYIKDDQMLEEVKNLLSDMGLAYIIEK